jgi:peptide-methionine (R)-S-oxide reductase
MTRRELFAGFIGSALAVLTSRRVGAQATPATAQTIAPLKKARAEWAKLLDADRYEVLFHEDTEFPGSSALNAEKRRGTYVCAACYLPLFMSQHKFESGTGWPSFTQPIEGSIGKRTDRRLFIARTEYHCVRCGGHQGHVFDDGPLPRGERWCNNGLALEFIPEGQALPSLRT